MAGSTVVGGVVVVGGDVVVVDVVEGSVAGAGDVVVADGAGALSGTVGGAVPACTTAVSPSPSEQEASASTPAATTHHRIVRS